MPSKYKVTAETIETIKDCALRGLNDVQTAGVLGIHRNTYCNLKKTNSAISDTLKEAKQASQKRRMEMAEDALEILIKGGYYEETTTQYQGEQIVSVIKKKKYRAPNTTATIFALCNLAPDKWKSINRSNSKSQ